jgi:beta-galactosidase
MVWSDHTPNPGLIEYKKVIEPVTARIEGGKLVVKNHYEFIDLSHLKSTWHLVSESGNTEPADLELPVIKGGEEGTVSLPEDASFGSENTWLALNFNLKNDTPWAKKGHEVAWAQVPLFHEVKPAPVPQVSPSSTPFTVNEKNGRLYITTPSFKSSLTFDLVRGTLQWSDEAGKIITKGPELELYRALTQNDVGESGDNLDWSRFRLGAAKTQLRSATWTQKDGVVTIVSNVRVGPVVLQWACLATMTYTISDGLVTLHTKGSFTGTHPATLPRIGLTLGLPKAYGSAEWFGRGPGESYRDKKASARFGRWKAGPEDLNTPYEWPQENGNRSDTRWVRVSASKPGEDGGVTLEARIVDRPFHFSLRKHETAELDRAKHPHDLAEADDMILNLDYDQHGIGTGSCGPGPWEQHRLHAGPFEFTTVFKVVEQ